MNKILVIGSLGFIGNHVFNYFKQIGWQVFGCDVLHSDQDNYYKIDQSLSQFPEIILQTKPNVCINAAGSGVVSMSHENPALDYELNTIVVQKILESIRMFYPSCKFIQISSAAVYGNPKQLPIRVTSTIRPLSPYGWHKYQGELICKEYFECFGVHSVILRIFSAYGPNLRKQILWDLYSKCKNNPQNIVLFGTGNESRDFIHIYDLVKAIECVVNHDPFSAKAINVANGVEVFIKDIAGYFIQHFKSAVKISFNGIQRKGDPTNWLADIGVLKSYGYEETIGIEQGIQSYIQWLNELK